MIKKMGILRQLIKVTATLGMIICPLKSINAEPLPKLSIDNQLFSPIQNNEIFLTTNQIKNTQVSSLNPYQNNILNPLFNQEYEQNEKFTFGFIAPVNTDLTSISVDDLPAFTESQTLYSQVSEATINSEEKIKTQNTNTQQSSSSLDDLARKAQDPLADIAAIVSDNTVNFGVGGKNNRTGANFQFQGVYSFDFPEAGFDLITRGISNFNIVPLDQGGDAWGLGDSITQFFFKPNLSGNWKFGIGPQFSLRTRTNENTGGPGWGAGPAIVVLGTEGAWTLGAVAGQLWSFDGDSSGLTIQPLIYYNFESMPGFSIGYDPIITADWKAKGGDQWTVPLGLTAGQLFDLGDGYALNVFVGAYGVPIRPKNGPQWQARLQLFLILPR